MSDQWTKLELGDVCQLLTGGTPSTKTSEYWDDGDIPWLASGDVHRKQITECDGRITELGLQNSNARMLPQDSVLIALNGQGKTRGTVAMLRIPATCNQSIVCMNPLDREVLLPEYLFYWFEGRYKELRDMTGDKDRRGLNLSLLRSICVPIPSLSEQQRVVATLKEAFEDIAVAIRNAVTSKESAATLFRSVVQSALERGGADWTDERLGDLCTIARGGSPRPIKSFLTTDPNGVNWVKISDATASEKYIFSTAQMIRPEGVSRSRLVNDGDFLLSNSMSFGRPYIMRTSGCIHDGWLVLSDYANRLDQDFLYRLLGSDFVFKQFDRLAAGSTVRNLNKNLAASVTVPVPPLDVQRGLAREFETAYEEVKTLESVYQRKADALDGLKASLLNEAFAGNL